MFVTVWWDDPILAYQSIYSISSMTPEMAERSVNDTGAKHGNLLPHLLDVLSHFLWFWIVHIKLWWVFFQS